MDRHFINTKKIQNSTRRLVLKLSDSTFITVRKIRQATKQAFGSNDAKEKQEFLEELASLLQSDSPTVRLAVVEALERVGREQTQTTEFIRTTLQSASTDTDDGVRLAVTSALERDQ